MTTESPLLHAQRKNIEPKPPEQSEQPSIWRPYTDSFRRKSKVIDKYSNFFGPMSGFIRILNNSNLTLEGVATFSSRKKFADEIVKRAASPYIHPETLEFAKEFYDHFKEEFEKGTTAIKTDANVKGANLQTTENLLLAANIEEVKPAQVIQATQEKTSFDIAVARIQEAERTEKAVRQIEVEFSKGDRASLENSLYRKLGEIIAENYPIPESCINELMSTPYINKMIDTVPVLVPDIDSFAQKLGMSYRYETTQFLEIVYLMVTDGENLEGVKGDLNFMFSQIEANLKRMRTNILSLINKEPRAQRDLKIKGIQISEIEGTKNGNQAIIIEDPIIGRLRTQLGAAMAASLNGKESIKSFNK